MLSTSSLATLRVTCLAALTSAAALNGPAQPQKSSRRTFLAGVAATPLLVAGPLKSRAASTDGPREPQASTGGRRDPRTTSAFFGLAAPPIQGMWSYAELVEQAKAENLATIQTAVQHDCIVATTHEGMRFASMVADKAVPLLLIGERVSHSTAPCLAPRSPHAPNSGPAWRVQTARSPMGACPSRCFPSTRTAPPCATWQASSSTCWESSGWRTRLGLGPNPIPIPNPDPNPNLNPNLTPNPNSKPHPNPNQADLLPWDTTPYGSLAEREAAQRGGAKARRTGSG